MRKRTLAICIAMLVLANAAIATAEDGEEEEIIKVMAVGMGKDSDAALKSALRNAVSQAVGTLVDSETMVENDEIIKDKILSHSGGFVEEYNIIGTPESMDGLVSIKIDASVKKMNLKRNMEAANILEVKKIDGQLFTKQIQVEEADAMFYEMLKDFPMSGLTVKLNGTPYYDDKNKRFVVEVKTSLDVEYIKALQKKMAAFLEAALPEPPEVVRSTPNIKDAYTNWGVPQKKKRTMYFPVFMNANRTMATWKRFTLTDSLLDVCRNTFYKRPAVNIELTIEGDIAILSNWYKLPMPYVGDLDKGYEYVLIMPMLDNTSSSTYFEPGTTEVVNQYAFDLSADDVKLIKDVKIRVEKR